MPTTPLDLLRAALSPEDYEALLEATQGGERLPFGPQSAEIRDTLLLTADESLLEVFALCEEILGKETEEPAPPAPTFRERVVFTFEGTGPQLDHFLGSLRQNGFQSSTLEAGEVWVHVYLAAGSDLDFHRRMETLRSLYELSSLGRGRIPKGRRLY